jgi:hypothetical protein
MLLPATLLELLHPAGASVQTVVLGSATAQPAGASQGTVDLLVLAPDARELRSSAWFADVAAAVVRVADEGLVYVFAPPFARARLLRLLATEGFDARTAFVHVRGEGTPRTLVELDRVALQYATRSIFRFCPPLLRPLLRWLPRPLSKLIVLAGPRIGVAVSRRPRALLEWLGTADEPVSRPPMILRQSAREGRDVSFIYRLDSRPLLLKVGDDAVAREARALAEFGPAATRAGAVIPECVELASPRQMSRVVAAQTLVDGVPAADVLAARPGEVAAVIARAADWLKHWNLLTASPGVVTELLLENELLASARALESSMPGGSEYRSWLERKASDWLGLPLPTVVGHLDLTMANVLLRGRGEIAVVDWEHARDGCLPLVDVFYAAADAAAAATSYHDRVDAFGSCFAPEGRWSAEVSERVMGISRALGLVPENRQLCFHACWLHHAANEQRAATGGVRTPFRDIVAVLAADFRYSV